VQEIYFDFENEKLYSKVVKIIPMQHFFSSTGIDLGLIYYWGISFEALPNQRKRK
jgi:hypothetical protein